MLLRIIAHEYVHKMLHSKQNQDAVYLDRGVIEIEAGVTSFLCMSLLGFLEKTLCCSASYLAGCSKTQSTKELLKSVDRIEKATKEILASIKANSDLRMVGV